MIKKNFAGTQQDLYTICKLAWHSCIQFLAAFTGFKTKYNLAFAENRIADVNTAENLPDAQARYAESEVLRVHLVEMATSCLNNWQFLKRYIADAFPEAEQKARLEEAGSDYYEQASHENWDSVQGLLTSGLNFITTHNSILLSDGFMPATFTAQFTDDKTAFNNQHQLFLDSEETAKIASQTKQAANNAIHADLMVMLLDGQQIFKYDEATRDQFVYAELLGVVSGVGQAGVRGIINSTLDGQPIPNAMVEIPELGKFTTTDADGYYILKPVANGTYNLRISADGYNQQIIENHNVLVGTVSTLDINLTPIE